MCLSSTGISYMSKQGGLDKEGHSHHKLNCNNLITLFSIL